jgi:DNA primase
MNRLVEMGFRPIIEDSDGRGGIHVWLPFSRPIDAKTAYRFSRHVAHDYQQHIPAIECFPKSPTVQNTEAK